MTANQIVLIFGPLMLCFFFVGLFLRARRTKMNQPQKVHGPHTPGAGYDAMEIARSKGNGMADGGAG